MKKIYETKWKLKIRSRVQREGSIALNRSRYAIYLRNEKQLYSFFSCDNKFNGEFRHFHCFDVSNSGVFAYCRQNTAKKCQRRSLLLFYMNQMYFVYISRWVRMKNNNQTINIWKRYSHQHERDHIEQKKIIFGFPSILMSLQLATKSKSRFINATNTESFSLQINIVWCMTRLRVWPFLCVCVPTP